ncbi:uncharacterized protein C7orf31 homolog [Actinia tenebrosa]|uniref:Uncharacterized protein C7orf31 homolog n=1 Tax=Actinia tenebrosa TaxID=6105 RepID=A0A6P8HSS7_ACTTE|nr:uncharacterized protein C7orf31 homolog [Actinia tenebrosa]
MVSTVYMSKLQTELYKQRHGFDPLSRTFQSAVEHNPGLINHRITTFPERYSKYVHNTEPYAKCPWGRARSYAGDAEVQLPLEHRPKCEPPQLLQKGHRHFGSGAHPQPRGAPVKQYYDLTQLKKSKLRWNDELLPRPTTAEVQKSQIYLPFPKESPLTSHMSRQAVFPRPEPYLGYDPRGLPTTPPSRVINKAMGSYGRREVELYQINTASAAEGGRFGATVKPVTITNPFFNRHDIISEFNRLHPSNTPTLRLPIQRLRKADWHAN